MEEKEAATSSSSRRQPLSAITQHERVSSSADVAVSGARSRSGRVEEIGARSRLSLSLSLSLSLASSRAANMLNSRRTETELGPFLAGRPRSFIN